VRDIEVGGRTYEEMAYCILEIMHMRLYLRDITPRRKVEEALKESEERYRTIFNDAILGIYQSTPGGRYLRVNPAFARISGYSSPEQMVGEVTDIAKQIYVNPDDRARIKKLLSEKGMVKDFPAQIRQRNGKTVWISINSRAVKDAKGKTAYYEGTIEDITERKKTEEALKESEERYRALVENSLAGIAILDTRGKIMVANDAAASLVDLKSGKDAVGKNVLEVMAQESKPALLLDIANVARGRGGYPRQYKVVTAKGKERWVESLGTQITYRGRPAIIININDITGRRDAEERLRQSEEKFRRIFEFANDGILGLDSKGFVISANKLVSSISGYPAADITGKHVGNLPFLPLESKVRVLAGFAQRMLGKAGSYEIEIVSKSGERIPLEINSSPIMSGGFAGAIAIVRDLRERKRVEAEKEHEHKITAGIVEGAALPIFVLDSGHKVIYWNKACEELTWWKAADMVGTSMAWKPLYAKSRKVLADHVLDGTMPKEGEYLIVKKSALAKNGLEAENWYELKGERTYLLSTAAQITDAQGNVLGAVETLLDVTEKKKAEELLKNESANLEAEVEKRTAELKAEVTKVERLSVIKDEFIRNVTHELKTPLSVIMLNIPLARRMAEAGKEKERDELLGLMERNAARLRNSIEDILELSRIGGVTEYKKEKVEVRKIADYAAEVYGPIAKRKGIGFEVRVEPGTYVLGDPSLLPYTVSNLVSNAIKFTDKGKVGISAKASGKEVAISVSDSGMGLSKENQKKLFTKFFKADASAPGTGVGLAIVKEIVEGHGGRISVVSAPGKGSTFTIHLPRA
jgi:PAS domain S-box-containing protein